MLSATLCFSSPASADPITISGGTLATGGGVASWFDITGATLSGQGRDRDADPAHFMSLGQNVSLTARFSDDFPLSRIVYNGKAFDNFWVDASLNVQASGAGSNGVSFSQPFSMTGILTGYTYSAAPERGHLVFSQPIQGSGVARMSVGTGGPSVVYNFASASSVVTPEPASLLLLGSGLALIGARLRGRKACRATAALRATAGER